MTSNLAEALCKRVKGCHGVRAVGSLLSARQLLTARVPAALGEKCEIRTDDARRSVSCEVIGFQDGITQLLPYENCSGLRPGMEVIALGESPLVPIGQPVLGRVLDGLGRPVDGRSLIANGWARTVLRGPAAMIRPRIDAPLETGIRSIDGLLTVGRGQRIGLFAGSGVGKSTLLGEIAKTARADLNVIALVGERGREVRPFLEDCLGTEGLRRTVVVLATSEETPLMRVRAMLTAITIADAFRQDGANVLFMVDSITRLAFAQREIGLLRGEPPGPRGYTPSVFQMLASVLEQLGTSERGSITGLITVLVDGDDMDEPIADAARSILDGHINLSRKLAAQNHFPAIDVLHSVSRLFTEVNSREEQAAASAFRECLATYADMEDLIQLGAYKSGSSPRIDLSIQLRPAVLEFLRQSVNSPCGIDKTKAFLRELAKAWRAVP